MDQLLAAANPKPSLSAKQRARLNYILIASDTLPDGSLPQPGNVYVPGGWDESADGSFPHLRDAEEKERFIEGLWADQKDEFLRELAEASVPCLLEITPACDHAARKADHARLLGGVLIKSKGTKNSESKIALPIKSRAFARQLEFLFIESPDLGPSGHYRLVVSARYLLSKGSDELAKHRPAFRLRHEIVTDMRAWFAGHAARPGYVSLR